MERRGSKEGAVVHRRTGSKRRNSKGRSPSKEATAAATASSKQVYIDDIVKPTLEQLSVMVFAEIPMPLEDPVSFLIERLVHSHKLKPPETGGVDQKEVQKLRETTSWLRGKMAQIDVIEEKTSSFEDPDPAATTSPSPAESPTEPIDPTASDPNASTTNTTADVPGGATAIPPVE